LRLWTGGVALLVELMREGIATCNMQYATCVDAARTTTTHTHSAAHALQSVAKRSAQKGDAIRSSLCASRTAVAVREYPGVPYRRGASARRRGALVGSAVRVWLFPMLHLARVMVYAARCLCTCHVACCSATCHASVRLVLQRRRCCERRLLVPTRRSATPKPPHLIIDCRC
jgi:hypothetical protein